ncbi:SGNH/GDSL hydrolase family protein [Mucilaginibacter sp. UYCu711]|uniref:SGNH/GDSL hydrolase family protein n=1 Tax=Mucilaginibacter sp. UYCu711 TaxID=3156339 RepID=UPI003D221F58
MRNLIWLLFAITIFNSCKKAVNPDPVLPGKAHKVLILGNSITYSAANPNILWYGNWGMAATSADKDYVHLLTARLKLANDSTTVTIKTISDFEVNFDTYDFDANLQTYRDTKPDILILRIGENVTRTQDAALFERRYVDLLNYFKATNPEIKILAVGSVFRSRDLPNNVMSKYSAYISLTNLLNDNKNLAYDIFPNYEVSRHPSDKGMILISDQIWNALKAMIY